MKGKISQFDFVLDAMKNIRIKLEYGNQFNQEIVYCFFKSEMMDSRNQVLQKSTTTKRRYFDLTSCTWGVCSWWPCLQGLMMSNDWFSDPIKKQQAASQSSGEDCGWAALWRGWKPAKPQLSRLKSGAGEVLSNAYY